MAGFDRAITSTGQARLGNLASQAPAAADGWGAPVMAACDFGQNGRDVGYAECNLGHDRRDAAMTNTT
jgi:hypothetical protein